MAMHAGHTLYIYIYMRKGSCQVPSGGRWKVEIWLLTKRRHIGKDSIAAWPILISLSDGVKCVRGSARSDRIVIEIYDRGTVYMLK